jgi:predicted dehydrogenase
MTLTAGVVGCGYISRFHFSGLEKAQVRIKWVCDLSEDAAKPWSKKYGADYTPDYKYIIADAKVDVVVVTPISSVHKQICLDAINAGKAVICEKTLTDNADDSLEVVTRAEEKQTIFYTSYMKRFIPAVEKAKELLPSLGQIISTHIRSYQPWGDIWETNPPESSSFHTPPGGVSQVTKNYGGGILICGGSHILDLVLFFLGRPRRVFATMYTPEDRDYDLQATALIETDNGTVLYEALAHPLTKIGFLRDGWDERIEITGTRGRLEIFSVFWNQGQWKASMLVHYDNATGLSTEYRYEPISPFDRAVAYFCRNIESHKQGGQSRLTGYEVDELITHICKSASTGQALDVKWRIERLH